MATVTTETIQLWTGVYAQTFTARTAGKWGCDPCWGCAQRPPHGARIWTNCYGDIYCDHCAQQLADLARTHA